MLRVCCIERSSGVFNDKPYENYNIYCLDEEKNENVLCGKLIHRFSRGKAYLKVSPQVLLSKYSVEYLKGCYGYFVRADYNQYGNVTNVIIQKDPIDEN